MTVSRNIRELAVLFCVASCDPAWAASMPPPGAASCSGCHALRDSVSSTIPRIYGRDANEIIGAMTAFHDGSRPATVMNRIAKGFSNDEMRAIAVWLETQK